VAKPDIPAIILCALIIGIAAVALSFFGNVKMTGAVVAVDSAEPLSLNFNESTSIPLNLNSEISSFKLSGNFIGESFSVYLLSGEQRLLVVSGENDTSFSEACTETCNFSSSSAIYTLEINILNGTLQIDNYYYGKPELVTSDVAEKVEPAVLVNETSDVVVSITDEADIKKLEADGLDVKYVYKEFDAVSGTIDRKNLDELAGNPDVEAVKADTEYQITLDKSVPFVNAPNAWQAQFSGVNVTGAGETVCIVDTGVNYTHPALAGNYLGGYDFVNDDNDPMDDNNHGTHVAGIIASNDAVYKGVAPGAKIVAVKTFSEYGSGSLSDILAGIDWCVANKELYNIAVMSMSFGDGEQYDETNCPSSFDDALNAAAAKGIALVAASGNNGYIHGVSSPACQQNVIAVGAVDYTDSITSWSSSGTLLDLLAPGVSITSTSRSGGFMTMSGTSMATPHVSGAIALLKQYNKLKSAIDLTPAEAEARLKATGKSITYWRNDITRSRIDILAAISPALIIDSPRNQTYSSGDLSFNITTEYAVNSVVVSIDGGNNNTMASVDNDMTHWYNTTIPTLNLTSHNATFYVNADAGISKTVFFTVATIIPPQIMLNSPANNSNITAGQIINLTVTCNAPLDTVWYKNSTSLVIMNQSNSGYYLIDTSNWAKGVYGITVYANNTAGDFNFSAFIFNLNNYAPTASNVAITPNSPDTSDNLACNWTYSDADNDTENGTIIKWFVNNIENSTFLNLKVINNNYTNIGQLWKCQVTPSDGKSFGTAVNSSETGIQVSPPVISSIYPDGGEELKGIVTLNASVTDKDGQADIKFVKFYYSSNSGATFNLIGNDTTATGNLYQLSWNTSKVAEGKNYKIQAEASDGIINTTKVSAGTFTINNVNDRPVVNIIAPNGGETWSGNKTIKWTATDLDDNDLTISIYYRASTSANWTTIEAAEFNTGGYTWNTATVSDGNTYQMNITAKDPAGLAASDISNNTFTISNGVGGGSGGSSGSGGGSGGGVGGAGAAPPASEEGSAGQQAGEAGAAANASSDEAQQIFISLASDVPATFAPGLTGLAVSEVVIRSKADAENVTAKIKKLDSVPVEVPDGIAYQYFELTAENLNNDVLSNVALKFEVPKSWAANKTVYLATLSGDAWQKLPTAEDIETDNSMRYIASVSHLSTFAIVGVANNTGKSNTFSISMVLASMILVVLFFMFKGRMKAVKLPSLPKLSLPALFKSKTKKEISSYHREPPDFGFGLH